ncbi:MAG: hypothetical protein GZ094_01265 [Mariniphaga sp.]|nr:hypothetical protein [Mariniphaga sp.]
MENQNQEEITLRQIERIKTYLFNARDVIETLDFFVEKHQIDRIKAWFPDLKQAVAELEIHINGNQSDLPGAECTTTFNNT